MTATGMRRASAAVVRDARSSEVARTGFKMPAVVRVVKPRARDLPACSVPAAPPPAMIASGQRSHSSIPMTREAVSKVPARTAAGPPMRSSA